MKEVVRCCLASVLLIICFSCEPQKKTKDNPNDIKALEEIRTEKRVEEAIITDANFLYISMRSHGESQLGYARYLCQLLYDHRAKTKFVKIVEYGTTNHPDAESAYGVLAGECYCPEWIEDFENPKPQN